MKKKIIYLSLGILTGMFITPVQNQAAEVLVANEDVFHDFQHEVEAAQVQAETANAFRFAYAAEKEAADIQAAKALSVQENIDQYIGGHPDIPIVDRLQGYLAILGLDADTLEAVVQMHGIILAGIPGNDIVEKINHLKRDITLIRIEHGKEEASKKALQRALAARDREQKEANQLMHQILCQLIPHEEPAQLPREVLIPLPEVALPRLDEPRREQPREAEALSVYQQRLLDQRQHHKIGDSAWRALDGTNPKLAAKLCAVIQENRGKIVEVSYLGDKNFTISINNKLQKNPYKF